MENYIANYVGRDIRALFPRLNIHNFRRFLTLLAQFSGHQLNMSTMATQMEFTYYRTIDKSGIDLVIEGGFGVVPVEIKLNATDKRNSLRGLENFIHDLNVGYGIFINRGKRVERLTDNIIQIPVNYI